MNKIPNSKQYDLEDRTYLFARDCRDFVKQLPKTPANFRYGGQLIDSSGSQAANYIEANESVSKKDFVHRIRICRKEAKESRLWLRLCEIGDDPKLKAEQDRLIRESMEIVKIFSAIAAKST